MQPDASVMGGISAVMDVFAAAKTKGTRCGRPRLGRCRGDHGVSYHAAFAAGGKLVEFPMLDFPLGREMMADQGRIVDGNGWSDPTAPGLGLTLTRPRWRRVIPSMKPPSIPARCWTMVRPLIAIGPTNEKRASVVDGP